jgi:hypothetical protein
LAFVLRTLLLLGLLLSAAAAAAPTSVALFYGSNPPWDELRAFDVVVVEPGNVPDPRAHSDDKSALFAYVAVGEVGPDRAYLHEIPEAWKQGQNSGWGSTIIDQSQPQWPTFFVERIIKPLWDAGYRGFFLDTLDSFQLIAKTDAERAKQSAGLTATIRELKKRYPQARLIFNRGFEVLPQVHDLAFAVAAESLFQGWDQSKQQYRAVPAADREWLLGQLNRVKNEYKLPVISIDYVPPAKRKLARETAAKIREAGFIPWVTTPELDTLGVGEIEVMPRKVLMVHNTASSEYDLIDTSAFGYGAMPLNYLGYVPEYVDARRPLPEYPLSGRYAGIVVWLDKPAVKEKTALSSWLKRQAEAGIPIALMGEGAFLFEGPEARYFGMQSQPASGERTAMLRVTQHDALIGFETEPLLNRAAFFRLRASGGKPLLTVSSEQGDAMDAVALMPWGGYALNPYALIELPSKDDTEHRRDRSKNMRWVINPVEFLRRALRLPEMPVPDVTTESGRRLLMVHMDGDGFASKSEFPGSPYAAEVMLQQVLGKYRLPATVSVIQGEIAPDGLYPGKAAALEQIARRMFALPHVEIASHSYSHPFSWQRAVGRPDEEGYHLKLPGYKFDLQKEIPGSIAYIESKLAPPGKKVQSFLWTGDCNIGASALEMIERAGVAGMNGGDTMITRSNPTLTLVAPLGVPKGRRFQVYAPNQNENVYTNNWLGPFYGYERVIETFEMTDAPYRLKPIDIYFHTYSASKPASLKALDKVFQWAQIQETMPLHVSSYVRKVDDFNHMVVARTADGWMVRGKGELRELRAPLGFGHPQIGASAAVAGYNRRGNVQYLHLAAGEARIRFRSAASAAPYLVSANAPVTGWREAGSGGDSILSLRGEIPLKFTLSMGNRCSVQSDGQSVRPDRTGNGTSHFSLRNHVSNELRIHCPR